MGSPLVRDPSLYELAAVVGQSHISQVILGAYLELGGCSREKDSIVCQTPLSVSVIPDVSELPFPQL